MNGISIAFGNMMHDSNTLMVAVLVFLAAGTLAFSIMAAVRVRGSVKRRTQRIMDDDKRTSSRSLRHSSRRAVAKLLEYTSKHYANADDIIRQDELLRLSDNEVRNIISNEILPPDHLIWHPRIIPETQKSAAVGDSKSQAHTRA